MKNAPTAVWALVTNGGSGRLLELDETPRSIREVATRQAPLRHLTSHELMSDASGRHFNEPGPAAHAMQPRSDPHEEAEVRFVGQWLELLDKALSDRRFKRLILVADPRTLGRLRAGMGKTLRRAVAAEAGRDLTQLALPQLEPRLRELAGWTD